MALRQPALGGSVIDLQKYLSAEMDSAYPELKGSLVFMPYREAGKFQISARIFANNIVEQYHRSALGVRNDARPEINQQVVDASIRKQAKELYAKEVKAKNGRGALGYHTSTTMVLPSPLDIDDVYEFSILSLRDDCRSCAQVKPRPAHQCFNTNPDTVLIERSDRINVAFHELAHHLAEYLGLKGASYATPALKHIEEVRSDLFGTLMEVRILGPMRIGKMQALSDANATSDSVPELYFNPRAFEAGTRWLENGGAAQLQQMSLSAIFNQANVITEATALSPAEIDAVRVHALKVEDETNAEAPAEIRLAQSNRIERMKAYQRLTIDEQTPTVITFNGKGMAYSEITYQFDLAMLHNQTTDGNPYANKLAHQNPLRAASLRANPAGHFNAGSVVQVAAINRFNRSLYGTRACVIKPMAVK